MENDTLSKTLSNIIILLLNSFYLINMKLINLTYSKLNFLTIDNVRIASKPDRVLLISKWFILKKN